MTLLRTLLIVAGLGLATAAAVAAWPVLQGSNARGFGDGAKAGHDHHEAGEHEGDHDD